MLTDKNFASDEITISKERYMNDVNAILATREQELDETYKRGISKGKEVYHEELKKKIIDIIDNVQLKIKLDMEKRGIKMLPEKVDFYFAKQYKDAIRILDYVPQVAKEERTSTPLVKAESPSQEARTLSPTGETTQFDSALVNEGSNPSPDTLNSLPSASKAGAVSQVLESGESVRIGNSTAFGTVDTRKGEVKQ